MTDTAETLKTAVQHHQAGRLQEAEQLYQLVLETQPDHPVALHLLGIAAHQTGRDQEALELISKAIGQNGQIPQMYNSLGVVLKSLGKSQEAIAAYQQAISLKPDYAEAYSNMASALQLQGRYAEALENCRQAVQITPDYAEAYNNMAAALQAQGQYTEALEKAKQAVQLRPNYAEAYNTMASTLQSQGKNTEAIENYRHTLQLQPDYAEVHNNLGMALLLTGEFSQGWKEFEWRLVPELATYPHRYDVPRWDGSSFVSKRLLVHYEQGLGDSIQLSRYLPMVKALGGTVILEERKPLLGLFQQFSEIDELVEASPDSRPAVNFDIYVPFMSLAGILKTTLETIPAEVPYIRPDTEKAQNWQNRLSGPDFKVGIAWAGRATHKNDRNRSCTLEQFASLAEIDGVKLYGLQKGRAASQLNQLPNGMEITNLGEQFENFADTAAAIENLDLVISVDTAAAHLAGAMGKKVWTLLPFSPDWRWMLDREDSPWYPTMRLFRQEKWGDWDSVFSRLAQQLRLLVRKSMATI